MPESPRPTGLFRFGVFEFDGQTGELRKNGRPGPRLVGQPLELLLQLLERRGELVSREELRQRLWPADTFVDYDHSLNTAVNKLREALNDAADNPRFIQTIPRRGYRFIAPLESSAGATATDATPAAAIAEATVKEIGKPRTRLLSDPAELPSIPPRQSRMLFSLLEAMYLSFYVLALANLGGVDAALARLFPRPTWVFVLVIFTAAIGIPIRLYLLSAAAFGYRGLAGSFRKLFPMLFLLDELWSLSPFLILDRIGVGLVLASTAALVFLPFSQRSVLLMGDGDATTSDHPQR